MSSTQCDTVRLLRESLAALETGTDSGELISVLRASHTMKQLLEQIDVATVAELQREGVFGKHGHRKPETALCDLLGVEYGEAHRMVVAADTVGPRTLQGEVAPPALPTIAATFTEGAVSLRHVAVAAELLTSRAAERLAPHMWTVAETRIAALAADCTPRKLRALGGELLARLDQHDPAPEDRPQPQVNELRLTPLPGGGGTISGTVEDPVRFATIRTVLDAAAKPRTADDPRRSAERMADALADVCGFVADHGTTDVLPEVGGRRPHVSLIAEVTDLENRGQGACLDFGGTLTPESLRMLCCDANVIPIVMDGAGQPLDVGRTNRVVPPHLRRAVEARDRGCAHPGCDRPPSWSEIHHIVHWADGGTTELRNLVTLCRVHHREIHATGWAVRIGADGLPEFIPPAWIDVQQKPRRHPRHHLTRPD